MIAFPAFRDHKGTKKTKKKKAQTKPYPARLAAKKWHVSIYTHSERLYSN
jgi:hypothetical protein